jgi:hypothetical protein
MSGCSRLGSGTDTQLSIDVPEMGLNCLVADVQPLGDLAVGRPSCRHAGDAGLTGRQHIAERQRLSRAPYTANRHGRAARTDHLQADAVEDQLVRQLVD